MRTSTELDISRSDPHLPLFSEEEEEEEEEEVGLRVCQCKWWWWCCCALAYCPICTTTTSTTTTTTTNNNNNNNNNNKYWRIWGQTGRYFLYLFIFYFLFLYSVEQSKAKHTASHHITSHNTWDMRGFLELGAVTRNCWNKYGDALFNNQGRG